MKEEIELLKAEIIDDLKSIKKIKSEYGNYIESLNFENPSWEEQIVIGYHLHNFYNGCENIFKNIALFFAGQERSQEWHKKLLKRMKIEVEDVRPAVISDDLYRILDDIRAFRHVYRHIYDGELDWQKEKLVAEKFDKAVELFEIEIEEFCEFLESIIE